MTANMPILIISVIVNGLKVTKRREQLGNHTILSGISLGSRHSYHRYEEEFFPMEKVAGGLTSLSMRRIPSYAFLL